MSSCGSNGRKAYGVLNGKGPEADKERALQAGCRATWLESMTEK